MATDESKRVIKHRQQNFDRISTLIDKGERITGRKTYFCHSVDELVKEHHIIKDGEKYRAKKSPIEWFQYACYQFGKPSEEHVKAWKLARKNNAKNNDM